MVSTLLSLLQFASFCYAGLQASCKCIPGDPCWPSLVTWDALNTTVSGKLIRNIPVAISCYPGTYQNHNECARVSSQWSNSTFQQLSPVGYFGPTDESCPPIDMSSQSRTCTLGPAPVYTINATEPEEVAAGIEFAQKNHVRLVIRNTGHDMLGRSEGYGALQIWIKYIRKGILFQKGYAPSDRCANSKWDGSAMVIAGGYVWQDVYKVAFERNLTIVGGGDPTVGCIGGYTQGGGHSPASHDYGLAADQVLEAQVVLANGDIVTANSCQFSDLYFAIRGGGGGTYGVVTSMTVKVYPSKPVVAQSLAITPLTKDMESLLDAITDIYQQYPNIMDAGFSGYGSWSTNSPMANQTAGYMHVVAAMGKSLVQSQKAFDQLFQTLQKYNGTSLRVSVVWYEFPTYGAYFQDLSGVSQPVGVASPNSAMTSRMFGKAALTTNRAALRSMIGTTAGNSEEFTLSSIELVGGGKVLTDASDKYSSVNPAWRSTYIVSIVARSWDNHSSAQIVQHDITDIKGGAMKTLDPLLGSYMNEADRNDPQWATNFYGTNYVPLALIKKKYDPRSLFYCPTCVGSPSWSQRYLDGANYGPLCPTGQ
ncbi:FAD linked oxidase, N-terminal [Penicillium expansum]|uniref:FAD linked oxidase, N-terminal n=1 Tax=Penicillium expansum TaxID=27334 RepID=A0A0A2JTW0_PENEN|nr:FAD linked oxidase, N-terminal [Penicillium expansum]KGO58251.1 FAD linked oxidase, N-terminal [Penicillium expansum]KGO67398.1 FAD linked oxidase, N-terminal [Penicillium expansum]